MSDDDLAMRYGYGVKLTPEQAKAIEERGVWALFDGITIDYGARCDYADCTKPASCLVGYDLITRPMCSWHARQEMSRDSRLQMRSLDSK